MIGSIPLEFANTLVDNLEMPPNEMALQICGITPSLVKDFTSNKTDLKSAFAKSLVSIGGGTNLKNQLLDPNAGILRIFNNSKYRRIAIVFTDGYFPEFNPADLQLCKDLCTQNNIQFYAILTSAPKDQPYGAKRSLKALSDFTGGAYIENVLDLNIAKDIGLMLSKSISKTQFCNISWIAEGCANYLDVDFEIPKYNLKAFGNYYIPKDIITHLEFSPNIFVDYGYVQPATYSTKEIFLTARVHDIIIDSLILNDTNFVIENINELNLPALLEKDDSIRIDIKYISNDFENKVGQLIVYSSACADETVYLNAGNKLKTQLTLTHPNGGELFYVGSDNVISWTGIEPSTKVSLSFSSDRGNTWKNISNNASGLISPWKASETPSDSCLMRVRLAEYDSLSEKYLSIGVLNSFDANFENNILLSGTKNKIYLWNLSNRNIINTINIGENINALKLSPTCNLAAILDDLGNLKIYQLNTALKIATLNTGFSADTSINKLIWSNNEDVIYIVNKNKGISRFNFKSGKLLNTIPMSFEIFDLNKEKDTAFIYKSDTIFVYNVRTSYVISKIYLKEKIHLLCFINSRNHLFIYDSVNKEIAFYDLASNQLLLKIKTSFNKKAIALFPNSNESRVAITFEDGSISFFDYDLQSVINYVKQHDSPVSNLIWKDDGKELITSSMDSKVKHWMFQSGYYLGEFKEHRLFPTDIAINPSNELLIGFPNGGFEKLKTTTGNSIKTSKSSGSIRSIEIENDFNNYLIADLHSIQYRNYSDDNLINRKDISDTVYDASWNKSKELISFSTTERIFLSQFNSSQLIDIDFAPEANVKWNPVLDVLAYSGRDGITGFYDLTTNSIIASFKEFDDKGKLKWSKNGKTLFSCGDKNFVVAYNPFLREIENKFSLNSYKINTFDLSYDNLFIACGNEQGYLIIWKIDNGQLIKTIKVSDLSIKDINWSYDGSYMILLLEDGSIMTYLTNEPPNDVSDAVFTIFKVDPKYKDIDFGVICLKDSLKDTIVTAFLTNDWGMDIKIDSVRIDANSNFELLTYFTPFLLKAGKEVDAKVRFKPTSEGISETYLTIYTPYTRLKSRIKGYAVDCSRKAALKTTDLSVVPPDSCFHDSFNKVKLEVIKNIGSRSVKIDSVRFKVNTPYLIAEDYDFPVILDSNQGLELSFISTPEDTVLRRHELLIYHELDNSPSSSIISHKREYYSLKLDPTSLSIQNLDENQKTEFKFTIYNSGSIKFILPNAPLNIDNKFELVSIEPKVCLPHDSSIITIEFKGGEFSNHYESSFQFEDECHNLHIIKFSADVKPAKKTTLLVSLPDTIVNPGEHVCIPVYAKTLAGIASTKFSADIVAPSAAFRFDNEFIKDSLSKSYFSNSINVGTDINIIGYICGLSLLTDKKLNKLELENSKVTSDNVDIVIKNGSISTNNVCTNDLRQVQIFTPPTLIITPNPVKDKILIDITSVKNENLDLAIFDINGSSVFKETLKSKGIDKVVIDANNLSAGVYLIICKTSSEVITKSIIKIN